jgi:hypothetical protein
MAQMMERMLAKVDAWQEEMKAWWKELSSTQTIGRTPWKKLRPRWKPV